MARTYTKPPLIEAICDLKFSSSQQWDWTIPGIFYGYIRDKFPIKEQLTTIETQIDAQEGKFVQKTLPKLRFSSETRDAVIQIAPDTLSIHQLPPYDGWISFKKRIIEYLELYRESAHPSKLTHIALRYIDHIEVPIEGTELEAYFRVLPQIPHPIPQGFASFLLNVDIPYDSATKALRVSFGTVMPKAQGNVAYVLDLNMFSVDDVVPSDNQIADWLEAAHEQIEVAFDASFTEKTRHEIFGEVRK